LKLARGRPSKPEGLKYEGIGATLHPDLAAWLRAQPLGISATISALIEKAMKKK